MGVDGRMTSGYTPQPCTQTISLQADSPSKAIFQAIAQATQAKRDTFYISGTISLPSTGEVFIGTRGVLKNFKPIPDAAKVLQPMDFVVVWESLKPTLL
jgi:enamine deaminase RidA (YjgF/YER057c/UK114 family)